VIVEKQSVVRESTSIPPQNRWGGNPAQFKAEEIIHSSDSLGVLFYLFQTSKLLGLTTVAYILWGCQIVIQIILYEINFWNKSFRYQGLISYILNFGAIFYIFAFVTILMKWILLGRVKAGYYFSFK
jgi:hypothetical protein